MSGFQTFDCAVCGDAFKALSESNAAESGTCSPKCATEQSG